MNGSRGILERSWPKLRGEREARLAGRIAEADFHVRQLTWIEIRLDLGGRCLELLQALKRGGHERPQHLRSLSRAWSKDLHTLARRAGRHPLSDAARREVARDRF